MGVSKELLMRRRNLDTPHIATATGAVASFAGNMAAPLKECKCEFTPVQSGSGDPSPSNVRPISGWTGCNVVRCGINVFDGEFETGMLDGSGANKSSSENIRSKNFIPIIPNIRYYIIFIQTHPDAANMKLYIYDRNKEYVSNAWIYGGSVITTPNNAYYARFYMDTVYSAGTDRDIAFNYPSTDTDYHPYTGSTYPVTFPAEAGTVYGGYVDLVRGVLVAEWANIASYNGETLPAEWKSDRDVYVAGTTPTTGAQVVYKLATPIEYPLTPQQITELVGTNNVFSNLNGNITVQYWKH